MHDNDPSRSSKVDDFSCHLKGLYRLAGPDLAGGRPGPSGVFGISERDWLSNYRVLKIEGFGGKPPVGGRPGARGPPPPLNPTLSISVLVIASNFGSIFNRF